MSIILLLFIEVIVIGLAMWGIWEIIGHGEVSEKKDNESEFFRILNKRYKDGDYASMIKIYSGTVANRGNNLRKDRMVQSITNTFRSVFHIKLSDHDINQLYKENLKLLNFTEEELIEQYGEVKPPKNHFDCTIFLYGNKIKGRVYNKNTSLNIRVVDMTRADFKYFESWYNGLAHEPQMMAKDFKTDIEFESEIGNGLLLGMFPTLVNGNTVSLSIDQVKIIK